MFGAVLHGGQRLTFGGALLFETNSAGEAVLTFGEDAVEATLDVYDGTQVRIDVDRLPARVFANGKEHPFTHDAEGEWVEVNLYRVREVRGGVLRARLGSPTHRLADYRLPHSGLPEHAPKVEGRKSRVTADVERG